MSAQSITVLISGGGTTLRNLIEKRSAGLLSADIDLVISSRPDARGLEFATKAGIESVVFDHKVFPNSADISQQIFDRIRQVKSRLVVCGGFLRRLRIPEDFVNRVINIHPSLIPDYCGQGMYGSRVHEAVIADGARESGCTVHYVDDQYDHGPVIAQQRVPVFTGDTANTLAARVFEAECELYPAAIGRLLKQES